MTRQEEIKNKAIEKSAEYRFGQFYSYNNDVYSGFIQGAEWADKNQPLPWIKIEDDEPCNHDELICSEDKNFTLFVIALVNNFVCLSRMEKIYDDWIWTTDVPTHWFAIPELPKE